MARDSSPADNSPILVTGAPRSGTTFLGRMLALPPHVRYLDEPFNTQTGIEDLNQGFLYIPDDSDEADITYRPIFERLLAGKSRFRSSLLPGRDQSVSKQMARRLFRSRTALAYQADALNPLKTRALVKDPMASFSAAYLHHRLHFDTVVIVRHPASTIASFKRLGWHFSLQEMLSQPQLMSRHLSGVLPVVDQKTLTPVQGWSFIWLSVYKALHDFTLAYPDMLVVRHNDVSREPDRQFKDLYQKLSLPYTAGVQSQIAAYTSSQNPVDAPAGVAHALKRDSAAAVSSWKHILTAAEIDEIRDLTGPVADFYFDSSDW